MRQAIEYQPQQHRMQRHNCNQTTVAVPKPLGLNSLKIIYGERIASHRLSWHIARFQQ